MNGFHCACVWLVLVVVVVVVWGLCACAASGVWGEPQPLQSTHGKPIQAYLHNQPPPGRQEPHVAASQVAQSGEHEETQARDDADFSFVGVVEDDAGGWVG